MTAVNIEDSGGEMQGVVSEYPPTENDENRDSEAIQSASPEAIEFFDKVGDLLETIGRSADQHHGISLQPDQVRLLFQYMAGFGQQLEACVARVSELEQQLESRGKLWTP